MIIWSTVTDRERYESRDRDVTGQDGNNGNCLYITRTRDGKTFSPAKEFFKPKFSCIDGQMVFLPRGRSEKKGRWIMVFKDEREVSLGGKNIRTTFAPADFSTLWTPVSAAVAGAGSPVRTKEMAEGPCLVNWQGKWFLYWDAFGNGHYCVAVSDDLKTWTDRTNELQMPPHPRHGTVFRAPRTVIDQLDQ